jgi:spermidine/putrescine-binding protein
MTASTLARGPSRRTVLKTFAGAGLGAVLLNAFGGAARASGSLNWSVWDTNSNPACFGEFEDLTGISLQRSLLSASDAQFAALKAGAGADWDVVNPTIDTAGQYIKAGLLKKLDLSRIPAVAEMYPAFRDSPLIREGEDVYALPYIWGLNPVVYRTDMIEGEANYSTLFDPKYKGKIAMWDFALMGIGLTAMHLGIPATEAFDLDDAELAEVKKALLAQKPLLRTYWNNVGDITNLFATGEVYAAFSWRNPYDELKGKLPLGMGTPKTGAMGWCDCFALPADLPEDRTEEAYKLADYLLGKAYARCIGVKGPYATTNEAVRADFTAEEQQTIFVDDLEAIPNFVWPKAPDNYAEWQKIWAEVKAS